MRRLAATQGLLLEVEGAGDGHSLGFGFRPAGPETKL